MYRRILLALCTFLLSAGCSDSSVEATAAASPGERYIINVMPLAAKATARADAIPAPPQVNARGYYLFDYTTGAVLAEHNADVRLEPASLTKLMAAYGVFRALTDGRIELDDQVMISRHARNQQGSRMFVDVGTQVSVEDLIQGMIVQSGNDAAVALAEHVAGSEPVFVDLMNQYAVQLGMTNTHFENTPGMPGAQHYTTARDMGLLASALVREFPDYYKWYSQREFTWNGITQPNRNGLLDRDPTVDGLKTGHTESAGYCLAASAKRGGMRLISVVMGSPSWRAREDASAALLNYGFRFYETRQLYAANQPLASVRVRKGEAEHVALAIRSNFIATLPRGQNNAITATIDVPQPLFAPLNNQEPIGTLKLVRDGKPIAERPVYPMIDVPAVGFFNGLVEDVTMKFE